MSNTFLEVFAQISDKLGVSDSPNHLVEVWQDFITSVNDGYNLTYFDYTNDLSIRDVIQKFLVSNELQETEGYSSFYSKIDVLDSTFLTLCGESQSSKQKESWWKNMLPVDRREKWSNDIFWGI